MADDNVIEFGDSIDITLVQSLHEKLSSCLEKGAEMVLDLSGVERTDAAGMQLLYCLAVEAGARNLSIVWKDPSDAFLDAADRLGLRAGLQLPG